ARGLRPACRRFRRRGAERAALQLETGAAPAPARELTMIRQLSRLRSLVLALGALAGCRRDAPDRIRATGTIEVREVDVTPLVPARVVRVVVDEGQAVRA